MSFGKDMQLFSDLVQQSMTNIFKDVVINVGDTVIGFSPVLTGRFKGNWQFTINSPSAQSLNTFDASGSSTLAKIISGAQSLTTGQVAYIVNNLTYGYEIETAGWPSGKEPYMPVQSTALMFEQIVEEAVRENRLK